jgi:hypothetical protein
VALILLVVVDWVQGESGMARTSTRQDRQTRKSDIYSDDVLPTQTNYETDSISLEDDLNNLRSMLHELRDVQSSNWWRALTAPTVFPGEGASARGVQDVNEGLYSIERKRVLCRRLVVGADVGPVAVGARHSVLSTAPQLPPNTTAAVGAVSTRGTVVASIAGIFDAPSLNDVVGSNPVQPKNLCLLVDVVTGGACLDAAGHEVYGLLQSESATDGHTIDLTSHRVQLSFVVRAPTGDDLVLAAVGAMDGKVFNYSLTERYAFADLPESALFDEFVAAMSALSRLVIDTDKNWGGFNIENVGVLEVVEQMTVPVDVPLVSPGDIRVNSSEDALEYSADGVAWHDAGSPKYLRSSATAVPEGNNSLVGLKNKFVVKTIKIVTSSTRWTLTVYSKDDYASDPRVVLRNRSGSCSLQWDEPYEDEDGTSEFHYNFTDSAGSNVHDIEVVGTSLR